MAKNYQQRECLTCGKLIRESAYSGKDGNFRKHVKSHEDKKVPGEAFIDMLLGSRHNRKKEEGK